MGSYVRNYERSVPRAPQPGVSKALDTLRHRPRAPLADAALNAPSTVAMPPTTSHLEAAVELTEEDQGTEDPTVEDLAVRVAVRARPLVAKERLERNRECLAYPSPTTVVLGKNRAFHFDEVFGPDSEQTRVYDNLVAPLVDACFDGYNATVLAYGQTGSGKTLTYLLPLLHQLQSVRPKITRRYVFLNDETEFGSNSFRFVVVFPEFLRSQSL